MASFESGFMIGYAPLGHAQVAVTTAATVTLPSQPNLSRLRRTMIRFQGQPMRFRDDGVAPTTSTGMKMLADDVLIYDGDITAIQIICDSSATGGGNVLVAYYGL